MRHCLTALFHHLTPLIKSIQDLSDSTLESIEGRENEVFRILWNDIRKELT